MAGMSSDGSKGNRLIDEDGGKGMKFCKRICFVTLAMMMSVTASAAETDAAIDMDTAKWSDYVMQIDEEQYQFPMLYEELTAKGWTSESVEGEELEPYQYNLFRFERDGVTATVSLVNLGINTLAADACIVGGMDIDNFDWELSEGTVVLPGGIVRGEATVDSVQEVYGTPSNTYEGDMYTKLSYETDYNSSIDLYIYKESGVLGDIEIENFTEPEGFERGEVNEELPEAVASYERPEALSDDMTAYEIELDGKAYTLPVTVNALLEDGWELETEDTDEYIAGAYYGWASLRKGGQSFSAIVVNQEPDATLPQYCWIEELEVGGYSLELEGALPGGVETGMKESDFLALLEQNEMEYEVESSGDFTYYTYNEKEYDQCCKVIVYTASEGQFQKDTIMEVSCSNAFE